MKNKLQVINYIFVLLLILLSVINISSYFSQATVLGVESEQSSLDSTDFWKQFIKSNPKYLPAYIELGEINKVTKLDPNFIP